MGRGRGVWSGNFREEEFDLVFGGKEVVHGLVIGEGLVGKVATAGSGGGDLFKNWELFPGKFANGDVLALGTTGEIAGVLLESSEKLVGWDIFRLRCLIFD